MKRLAWSLSSLLNQPARVVRRKAAKAFLQPAELLEIRALLDASVPLTEAERPVEAVAFETTSFEATSFEVTDVTTMEEMNPEIFYTFGGPAVEAPPVTKFESREQFGEFLIERALQRYDGYFDQPNWYFRGPIFAMNDGQFRATSTVAAPEVNFSETNTQVAGVDEGDTIESDGEYLYVLNGQDLLILRAESSGELDQVSRVRLEGYPVAEYLDGDRLTVISSQWNYANDVAEYSLTRGFIAAGQSQTIVSTFDVSDRSNPTLVKEATIDGNYVDSRSIDGQVHLITTNDLSLPAPRIDGKTTIEVPVYYYGGVVDDSFILTADAIEVPSEDSRMAAQFIPVFEEVVESTESIEVDKYESRESYIARTRELLDTLIDEALPRYSVVTTGGLAAMGNITEIGAISQIADANSDSLLSVVTIDTRDAQPGLASASSVIATYTNGVYANRDHLYVFSPIWGAESSQTRVLEFAWANGEREIELIGTGVVDGTLHNQFSADEFDGRLRIVTTTSSYADNEFRQANNLVVLENVDGLLTEVGAVTDFAATESVYSVRFDGERAFVVTFRQTDPLFLFDLSDPTKPEITGELEVPGYSSYLQVIDQNHLLAIGRSVADQSVKVAVYNVSDPANPVEVDEDILPSWTWSIGEWDHHAIGYYGANNTLAIPIGTYDYQTYTYRNELMVFNIDTTLFGENVISTRGAVHDDGNIVRSAFIGDSLFTVSTNSVIGTDLLDPSLERDRIEIESEFEVTTLDIKPIYTEIDDGAADWEFVNAPESEQDGDDLLALAAKNLLNGQIRVTLLQTDGAIDVSLLDGNVTAASAGHDTETIALGTSQSLVIDGTDAVDRVSLNFANPGAHSLTEIVVSGGLGNDQITVTGVASSLNRAVLVNGDEGHDVLVVQSTVRSGVFLSGGLGRDTLTGGSGADWLHGGPNNDVIDGGTGNDSLFGGGGSDSMFGRNGHDFMNGGGGDDYLNGGNGDDTVDGGEGNDAVRGSFGNDLLRGGNGNDFIQGDDGNDTILGGDGNDRLDGGVGNDAIAGGLGDDTLIGGVGNDSLLGGDGNDVLRGGVGQDVLLGEDGDDHVDGGSDADTVSGGAGQNRVVGLSQEIDENFVLSVGWLSLL